MEPGRGVRLCLTTQAVKKNMQEDSAAFEGWALLIHAYCKFHVELDLSTWSTRHLSSPPGDITSGFSIGL